VVDAVRHHLAVVPSDRDDVHCYIAKDMKILVTDDHHVLGVTPRDPGEALPDQKTGPAKKIVRKASAAASATSVPATTTPSSRRSGKPRTGPWSRAASTTS
jgi:hypothetical protein